MDTAILKNRYDALTSDRKTMEETWQWIENLVVPFRGKFFRTQQSEAEIIWNQQHLFDTTAIQACDILSSAMQGSLTSPTVKWFGLQFLDEKLNANPEARSWTETCEDLIFDALQVSNFNTESSEFYIDLTSFGTGVISEEVINEDTWEGLDFQAVPMRECFFESDYRSQIKRFYRRLQWTPLQVIDKFGRDAVPDWVIEKEKAASQTQEKIDVIFAIYEVEKNRNVDLSQPLPANRRPFAYKYFFHKDASQVR